MIQFIDTLTAEDLKKEEAEFHQPHFLKRVTKGEKERLKVYLNYAADLNRQAPRQKLSNQIRFTKIRLEELDFQVGALKSSLKALGYFQGDPHSQEIDQELIKAIEQFQEGENLLPVDGIYGELTHEHLMGML